MIESPELMPPIPSSSVCSKNGTCEINQTVLISCTADAHRVDTVTIHFEDCSTFQECYSLQTNEIFIAGLLATFEVPQAEALVAKGRLIETEVDEEFLSNEPNRVQESLNLWTVKRSLRMKKFHLVLCYASNEKGHTYESKILIPSNLDRGKLFDILPKFERGPLDKEIVEGDNFSLKFRFSNVLYNSYKVDVKPHDPDNRCELDKSIANKEQFNRISLYDNDKSLEFAKIVELRFTNIIQDCSYNYSIEMFVNSDIHSKIYTNQLRAVNPVAAYNLHVVSSLKPYFVVNHEIGNSNKTIVHVSNSTSGNETSKYVVAYSDIDVASDETVELNCENHGRPRPMVTWLKDGQPLNLTDQKYRFDASLNALRIVRTHAVDSGKYYCHVQNRYGEIERAFDVKVKSDVLRITVKELTRKQIVMIVLVSVLSFFLLVGLIIALVYAFQQKREHTNLVVSIQIF